jgi:hypothetical protein
MMVEYARWPRCLTAVTSREDASNVKSNEPRCEDEPKKRSLPSVAHPKLCALGNMMQGTIACLDARILSSGSQPALKKRKGPATLDLHVGGAFAPRLAGRDAAWKRSQPRDAAAPSRRPIIGPNPVYGWCLARVS